jgi:ABC-2 type transport system ATP-binding protein
MRETHVVAKNLGKAFGAHEVLHGLTFSVEPGDVVGVLGKNGAGKTTLLELMLGFTPASEGQVEVFGHEAFNLPGESKARVGFVPQQDELINQLNARDQLSVIASFYPRWDEAFIQRLCKEWGVDLKARIKGMSVGERQKLSILLALGHKPELLVLDEPVASLDPLARRQFLEQIVEVTADGERSVVFSSHIVSDIERLANKIWILKGGRLQWQGDLDSLKDSIVRVHVRGIDKLPDGFHFPNALNTLKQERYAMAVVHGFSPALRGDIEARCGTAIEVEPLSLEEIFLELQR